MPNLEKVTGGQATSFKAHSESTKRNAKPGPRRPIARRGTEVFIAVGKEIRWADLVYLKTSWEDKQESDSGSDEEERAQGYRVSESQMSVLLLFSDLILDHQDYGSGRYQAACHFSLFQLPRHLDYAYGSYCSLAGFFSSYGARYQPFAT